MTGKIFYNSEGRQEGIYIPSPIQVKSMILQPQAGGNKEMNMWSYIIYGYSEYNDGLYTVRFVEYTSNFRYKNTIQNIHGIFGIKINDGSIQYVTSIGMFDSSIPIDEEYTDYKLFTLYGGEYSDTWFAYEARSSTLYLNNIPEDKQITVYYV